MAIPLFIWKVFLLIHGDTNSPTSAIYYFAEQLVGPMAGANVLLERLDSFFEDVG